MLILKLCGSSGAWVSKGADGAFSAQKYGAPLVSGVLGRVQKYV